MTRRSLFQAFLGLAAGAQPVAKLATALPRVPHAGVQTILLPKPLLPVRTYKLAQYGRAVRISRQMLVNDELAYLSPEALAFEAREAQLMLLFRDPKREREKEIDYYIKHTMYELPVP